MTTNKSLKQTKMRRSPYGRSTRRKLKKRTIKYHKRLNRTRKGGLGKNALSIYQTSNIPIKETLSELEQLLFIIKGDSPNPEDHRIYEKPEVFALINELDKMFLEANTVINDRIELKKAQPRSLWSRLTKSERGIETVETSLDFYKRRYDRVLRIYGFPVNKNSLKSVVKSDSQLKTDTDTDTESDENERWRPKNQ